jgi:GLPGLI family protein
MILIINFKAISQKQTSIGKIEYEMIVKTNNNLDIFNATLIFNEQISKFIFNKKQQNNEIIEKKGKEDKTIINIKINDTISNSIINDLNKKEIYNITKEEIIFEENNSQNWNLVDEEKNIGNLKCKKATCSFRGRDYIAWFSDEVPLPFGPWKFNGLPGLIIEISDKANEVFFSLININIPYNTEIKNIKEEDKKISRDDFKKKVEKKLKKQRKEIEEKARIIESTASKDEIIKINVSTPIINKGIELD